MRRLFSLACVAGLIVLGSLVLESLGPIARAQKGTAVPRQQPAPIASSAPCSTCVNPTVITALPFTAPTSGYYCLQGDLSAPPGMTGIEIDAVRVVIDLNGFSIDGTFGVGDGIKSTRSESTVVNGLVVNWKGSGVITTGAGSKVEHVAVKACGQDGIALGIEAVVRSCRVSNVQGSGISTSVLSKVLCCTVDGARRGILVSEGCIVEDCIVRDAFDGNGIDAFIDSQIRGCYVANSAFDGIHADGQSTIVDCRVLFGSGVGIVAKDGVQVLDCFVTGTDGTGIMLGDYCRAQGSVVQDTGGWGIGSGLGAQILECTAAGNLMGGIHATEGSRVVECIVSGPDPMDCPAGPTNGIEVGDNCVVVECVSNGHGMAGIYATGSSNRIEENHVFDNDVGIGIGTTNGPAEDNLIVKNSANGNTTDYDVSGNNSIGPTITDDYWILSENAWNNFHLDF